MTKKTIDIEKCTITKVFSQWYSVPAYQRHYVWDEDNITSLLDDIRDNYLDHKDNEYFLGSYIVQRRTDRDTNDLLDGQQRITTLFLLFAFLRDSSITPNEIKGELQNFIYQKAQILQGIHSRVRLSYEIRGHVKDFINTNIAPEGSVTNNWDVFVEGAKNSKNNESIRHICRAMLCFDKYFKEKDNANIKIVDYISFIFKNMVMIHISADTLEDAFRLFSIMNDRGVRLSNADILKASNLECIDDQSEINKYAELWEDLQADLGDDFDRFLMYVRTLYATTKAKVGLLEEYKNIFNEGDLKRGRDFFNAIKRWHDVYCKVIELEGNNDTGYCNFVSIVQAAQLSTDWIPVVMAYYNKFRDHSLLVFAQKVVHKAVADIVCGETPSRRIDNMRRIINLVKNESTADAVLQDPNAFAFQKGRFLDVVQSDMYGRRFAKMLLLLLEYKYQDNTLRKTFSRISIEHILPQNPDDNSQWTQQFTDEERQQFTHKLGNLCIIGRCKNSSLGNLDYKQKLNRYFKNNIANFARSLYIYHKYPNQWTPVEYKENMAQTIEDLKQIFEI